jgi:hypothetical protein
MPWLRFGCGRWRFGLRAGCGRRRLAVRRRRVGRVSIEVDDGLRQFGFGGAFRRVGL